ncbi:hypothetical protein LH464_15130 [Neorhizobium sp. T786]|uniref:hypothetical protein n=1 Tax=Pseudorhizobium xiangyangii TaxID=2883104 RepID=UPI001CFFCB96|nr:hypothetical protein [Neorhizobium xiangyangii]MCB5203804.1 hypothetical protein [Neorhizobium xiangyangii]
METKDKRTPTGLSPSADSPEKKKRKIVAGRGLALFIAGFGLMAFALYLFIVVYGVTTSE